ncbi:hypothetical protein GUITHDRAFT_102836 [Guillardia theta CCMP2712]|uniref:Integrator complex subunit 14 C-terminal domain-containing protein n=1 Tax=Guillardia theta (strain CCMP2712) TaxID=905079 RepID=L1JU05_GUITC|nr:hypothetical protein GUITHDRAFT_102836 [Guillardia theta CCMP2712]EKX51573.1 hypothetical protein GUITHDRAFT_102836 [Guillardia theta CCMP2712]|eukprot:XP_005838553.1 hypothetical protein GUITHDRAFT_102836 [Guillardia theta CCMP2712]
MSSSCKVLVPFEDDPRTDHKKLRTALYDIELEDTANVTEAMKSACSLLREKFSVSAVGCQVVIVVDGAPSFAELRQLRDIVNHLPKSIVFHIIAMGSDDELHRCSIYQTLAERSRGLFDTGGYKNAFTMLAKRFFQPYQGMIVCGHFQTSITLYPDPNLAVDSSSHGMTGSRDVPNAPSSGPVPPFIAIRGFIQKSVLVTEVKSDYAQFKFPISSKHIVFPDLRSNATPQQNCSFLYFLLNSLLADELVAVCHLLPGAQGKEAGDEARSCFLLPSNQPASENSSSEKKTNQLQLTLCDAAIVDKSRCKMVELINLGLSARSSEGDAKQKEKKQRLMAEDSQIPSPETLQSDLAKVLKNTAQLPAKKEALYKDCERLRRSCQMYMMPNIREATVQILKAVMEGEHQDSSGDKETAGERSFYIKDLMDQLSRSDLSQPIVPPPAYEPESAKKKGGNKASLENILG